VEEIMPTYTLTQILRGDKNQKLFLESVTKELQWKGGHIINIKSEVGRAVDQTTFNVVTITYEATTPIKYRG
jgi:hypothetical protein